MKRENKKKDKFYDKPIILKVKCWNCGNLFDAIIVKKWRQGRKYKVPCTNESCKSETELKYSKMYHYWYWEIKDSNKIVRKEVPLKELSEGDDVIDV